MCRLGYSDGNARVGVRELIFLLLLAKGFLNRHQNPSTWICSINVETEALSRCKPLAKLIQLFFLARVEYRLLEARARALPLPISRL